eukprot:CAMPEP_0182886980 /NCGR_PEP_ID=MMETSP0034_2-20130328/20541_1 /TAXON_ID=156128 /ORGANISM="Nephroselmis pyriformis, Strain CCMP717" /LENGTH=288 /DNA_ID=CAMNT_0025020325 /DNA_START=115 /DNA_END=978 /DNA_ORIENTATION=-
MSLSRSNSLSRSIPSTPVNVGAGYFSEERIVPTSPHGTTPRSSRLMRATSSAKKSPRASGTEDGGPPLPLHHHTRSLSYDSASFLGADDTEEVDQSATTEMVVERLERIMHQNKLFWLVNGQAELDGGKGAHVGSEIKKVCLAQIESTLDSGANWEGCARAVVEQLQQFDLLEQQTFAMMVHKAKGDLSAIQMQAEEDCLEHIRITTESAAARQGGLSHAEAVDLQVQHLQVLNAQKEGMAELEAERETKIKDVQGHLRERRDGLLRRLCRLLPNGEQMVEGMDVREL